MERTRPVQLASFAEGSELHVEGVNAYRDTPQVDSNEPFEMTAKFHSPLPPDVIGVTIVARLPEQGEEGFEFLDFRCDTRCQELAVTSAPDGTTSCRFQSTLVLQPDEYNVRYYLETRPFDLETGDLPRRYWIGSGKLLVLPGFNTKQTFVPLDRKEYAVPNQHFKEEK